MVGLTNDILHPGDLCYIVVYTPRPLERMPERIEFLEGEVTQIDHQPVERPIDHPIWKYYQEAPKAVRSIAAIVRIDPYIKERLPVDPIIPDQEPQRHYLVIPSSERDQYYQQTIDRQGKMNRIQLLRIKALEKELKKFNIFPRLKKE
ncbi:MAG TPA: hypothetical protein VJB13_02755 [Candidatus Nanoarchaeia archaeon]|nr:hypothetical protein [Candidatus Nanoarchaeia archaeon]